MWEKKPRGSRRVRKGDGEMLTLPIKKKWFDMILSGEKKEEYREIKPYYTSRFIKALGQPSKRIEVILRNGYLDESPQFIADCHISVGTGKEEWGAEPGVRYYILKIDRIRWADGRVRN